MFKIGDKVVFVSNIMLTNKFKFILKKYHIYTVCNVIRNGFRNEVIVDEAPSVSFDTTRFVHLTEYRKRKLEKICSKLEM